MIQQEQMLQPAPLPVSPKITLACSSFLLRQGERMLISMHHEGFNPNAPLHTEYASSAGDVSGNATRREQKASICTKNVKPGKYFLQVFACQLDKQQNVCASAQARVSFEVVGK